MLSDYIGGLGQEQQAESLFFSHHGPLDLHHRHIRFDHGLIGLDHRHILFITTGYSAMSKNTPAVAIWSPCWSPCFHGKPGF